MVKNFLSVLGARLVLMVALQVSAKDWVMGTFSVPAELS